MEKIDRIFLFFYFKVITGELQHDLVTADVDKNKKGKECGGLNVKNEM